MAFVFSVETIIFIFLVFKNMAITLAEVFNAIRV